MQIGERLSSNPANCNATPNSPGHMLFCHLRSQRASGSIPRKKGGWQALVIAVHLRLRIETLVDTDLPPLNGTASSERILVGANKGRQPMPRGQKELAEQITPELREVEVEVGRGKTVLEAVKKIGVMQPKSPA